MICFTEIQETMTEKLKGLVTTLRSDASLEPQGQPGNTGFKAIVLVNFVTCKLTEVCLQLTNEKLEFSPPFGREELSLSSFGVFTNKAVYKKEWGIDIPTFQRQGEMCI